MDPIYFPWQNEILLQTIYPLRNQKLIDFLVSTSEIEIWRAYQGKNAQRDFPSEVHDYCEAQRKTFLQTADTYWQIDQYFRTENASTNDEFKGRFPEPNPQGLEFINQFHRAFGNFIPKYINTIQVKYFISQRIREFEEAVKQSRVRAGNVRHNLPIVKRAVKRSEPDRRVEQETLRYQMLEFELGKLYAFFNAFVLLERQIKTTVVEESKGQSLEYWWSQPFNPRTLERLQPSPDPSAVRVEDLAKAKNERYHSQLSQMNHQQLLEEVVHLFVDNPARYPLWLQYMILHFSGMRNKSWRGTWADPKELLHALFSSQLTQKLNSINEEGLKEMCRQRYDLYQKAFNGELKQKDSENSDPSLLPALALAKDERWQQKVLAHMQRLSSSSHERCYTILLDLLLDEEDFRLSLISVAEAIEELQAMRPDLPEWMWKEIVRLTELRTKEVSDPNWEKLSPEEQAARDEKRMSEYRQIMQNWMTKNITGWREEHTLPGQLQVTAANDCEIEELIQSLRGNMLPGGLTAKPNWYIRSSRKAPAKDIMKPYFRRIVSAQDLKPGADIFWLAWSKKQPNSWQVARAIDLADGLDLIPMEKDEKCEIIKTDNGYQRRWKNSGMTEWLRWSHVATVGELGQTADGMVVLTFESSMDAEDRRDATSGVYKRNMHDLTFQVTASQMNGTFIGFTREAEISPELMANLREKLDFNRIVRGHTYSPEEMQHYWDIVSIRTQPPFSNLFEETQEPEESTADVGESIDETSDSKESVTEAGKLIEETRAGDLWIPDFNADMGNTPDLIGIQDFADAFATLAAYCRTPLPLAIGLFGEWGSGKTFFMQKMDNSVRRLSKLMRESGKMQRELPFYKNIVQIWFNAWHYNEGNIWASLAEHIIRNLAEKEDGLKPNVPMLSLMDERLSVAMGIAEAHRRMADIDSRRKELRAEIEQTQAIQAKLTQKIQHERSQPVIALIQEELDAKTKTIFNELNINHLTEDALSARLKLCEAKEIAGENLRWISTIKQTWHTADKLQVLIRLLWLAAALALIALLNRLNIELLYEQAWMWFERGVVLISASPVLKWAFNMLNNAYKQRKLLKDKIDVICKIVAKVDSKQRKSEEKITALITEKDCAQNIIIDRQNEIAKLDEDWQAAREEIEKVTPARIMARYLKDRSQSSDYRKHLGLLSMIYSDFKILSEMMQVTNWQLLPDMGEPGEELALLLKREEKIRKVDQIKKYETLEEEECDTDCQVNRIILYIDDLDRCPPENVEKVLQAVNLLLSLPLFVVVVGVDARWIKDALKARYQAMLHIDSGQGGGFQENIFGRATPEDYLEKIFQIPFWLKPMDKNASWKMIEGLLEGTPGDRLLGGTALDRNNSASEQTTVIEPTEELTDTTGEQEIQDDTISSQGEVQTLSLDVETAGSQPADMPADVAVLGGEATAPVSVVEKALVPSPPRSLLERTRNFLLSHSLQIGNPWRIIFPILRPETWTLVMARILQGWNKKIAGKPSNLTGEEITEPQPTNDTIGEVITEPSTDSKKEETSIQTSDTAEIGIDQAESDPQASAIREQKERQRLAAETVTQAASRMIISQAEMLFMQQLTPLLGRSPRALKRFINIYRLIKAGLNHKELEEFMGPSPGKANTSIAPYQWVLFLLAVDTGLPSLARHLFDLLHSTAFISPPLGKSRSRLKLAEERKKILCEKLQLLENPDADPEDPREKLRSWLEGSAGQSPAGFLLRTTNFKPLIKYTNIVNRYSFQAYATMQKKIEGNAPEPTAQEEKI